MNIFNGIIKNGKFVMDDENIIVTPSEEDLLKLKNYEGKKVFLGIRL